MNMRTREILKWLQISLGVILASIGLKAFLLPNGFLDGGVTGIAILLSELFGLNISLILILVSIPFLILSWQAFSFKVFLQSSIAIAALALFIHLENFNAVTEDKLLIASFGGLFLGAGIGLTIKNGAVLDGSEILGVYINKRFGISIGKVILVFNIILFSFTALLVSVETAMYSILTFLITAKIVDLTIEGFEDFIGLMIVSDQSNIIQEHLVDQIGAGITVYTGEYGYGSRGAKANTKIIHTVINRIDIVKTYNLINRVDENAFIIEFDVNNVKGGVLKKYLTQSGST